MKSREEVVNSIEDAWVLQELLYEQDVFNNDDLCDKTLEVIGAFADIIYEMIELGEEEEEEIQNRVYEKSSKIKYIMEKTEQ